MNDVFRALAQEPYEARGIIHSEMALLIYTVRQFGINRIIESGRARGQSTYLMAKYLPDVEIHSVELRETPDSAYGIDRVKGFSNVTLYWGDGRDVLPWLADNSEKPTAVLCDGPKGGQAVDVLLDCFSRPQVKVGFIHDMRILDHGKPSPHRAAAVARLPNHLFSDHYKLVEEWSKLDAKVAEAGGPCGPQFEAEFGSYGPTLGVFMNTSTKQNRKELINVLIPEAGQPARSEGVCNAR
jgi:hypothetical protein